MRLRAVRLVNTKRLEFGHRERPRVRYDLLAFLLPKRVKSTAPSLKRIRTRLPGQQLEWRDIQGDVIRLRPEVSKNAEGRMIVMVGELADIIEAQKRKDLVPWVFHHNGEKIKPFHWHW